MIQHGTQVRVVTPIGDLRPGDEGVVIARWEHAMISVRWGDGYVVSTVNG